MEALFTSALAVGLRSGECSALRWPDIDLENGAIYVRHTLQRKKGEGLVLMRLEAAKAQNPHCKERPANPGVIRWQKDEGNAKAPSTK